MYVCVNIYICLVRGRGVAEGATGHLINLIHDRKEIVPGLKTKTQQSGTVVTRVCVFLRTHSLVFLPFQVHLSTSLCELFALFPGFAVQLLRPVGGSGWLRS